MQGSNRWHLDPGLAVFPRSNPLSYIEIPLIVFLFS
jgi:hypothetical protein